jgi:hypothetical protein
MDIKTMASRVASRLLTASDLCVVCGKPGDQIRYTVRGADGTQLTGRVFLKGTVLCESHQEMLEGI